MGRLDGKDGKYEMIALHQDVSVREDWEKVVK